jgi:hypothetical protein
VVVLGETLVEQVQIIIWVVVAVLVDLEPPRVLRLQRARLIRSQLVRVAALCLV